MPDACPHPAEIRPVPPPADVCEACTLTRDPWSTLRQCLICGATLCCDSSPNRHMSAHFAETRHPVMGPVGLPGEPWVWCFVDELLLRDGPDGWQEYDPFLESGLWFAGRHLAEGGDPDLAYGYEVPEGFPLGRWFGWVRDRRASGELRPADEARIEALPGWRW